MKMNSKQSEIEVSGGELMESLPRLYESGVTEFYVHDQKIASDRKALLSLIELVGETCQNLFLSLPIQAKLIDRELVDKLAELYVSIEIPLEGELKNGSLTLNRKLYKNKADILNHAGLVFGFRMGWGIQKGDSFKAFRDRLDFATSLFPNHIDFPQFEQAVIGTIDASGSPDTGARPTGTYSSKDLDFSRSIAFACRTFYTAGRAVPWFNQLVSALKISPSTLFADADEWQQCNNCSIYTDFVPEEAAHKELEKMQLTFFKEKFEEKHKGHLWPAAEDLIRLNGAMSRVIQEGEECQVELSYNPDDLLSPAAANLAKFCDSVTEEPCAVKIFEGRDGASYKIL
ncbi:MAG: hypothetical protein IJU95_10450 [Treponema sp.]|nr:hypothetical protein [Treponema sp.]